MDNTLAYSFAILREISADPQLLQKLALLLVALALLVLCRFIAHRSKSLRVFDNEAGHISISRAALAELVESSSRQVSATFKPSVRIWTKGRRIHLQVNIRIESNQRLTEVSKDLQAHLTKVLHNTLGVEQIGTIDIKVVGFRLSNTPPPTKNPAPP